jgi:hypothetical protein
MKPNRHAVTLNVVESFIREYFDQNPISQLGIIVTKNSRAEKITELSGKDQGVEVSGGFSPVVGWGVSRVNRLLVEL